MKKATGKSAMSKGKAKKHRKVREMHIKPGAGGGYIARHDLEPDPSEMAGAGGGMAGGGGMQESPQYPLADQAALHAHIDEHMPEQSEETEDGAAGGGAGAGAGM
jgi:hypothetical protein